MSVSSPHSRPALVILALLSLALGGSGCANCDGPEQVCIVTKGDVNLDGLLTLDDMDTLAFFVEFGVLASPSPSLCQRVAGDMNLDGFLTIMDMFLLSVLLQEIKDGEEGGEGGPVLAPAPLAPAPLLDCDDDDDDDD